MNGKLDRRKKYTRMVLKQCLMVLLKEKPIASVTVKELCELADINRSTFYSHYKDPFDLLAKITDEVVEDMNRTLNEYKLTKEEEALKMTERILQYVADNRELCQTLLSDHGDRTFRKRIMKLTQDFMMQTWIDEFQLRGEVSEYMPLIVISGSIEAIERWLQKGMKESPRELAILINQFINNGLAGMRE